MRKEKELHIHSLIFVIDQTVMAGRPIQTFSFGQCRHCCLCRYFTRELSTHCYWRLRKTYPESGESAGAAREAANKVERTAMMALTFMMILGGFRVRGEWDEETKGKTYYLVRVIWLLEELSKVRGTSCVFHSLNTFFPSSQHEWRGPYLSSGYEVSVKCHAFIISPRFTLMPYRLPEISDLSLVMAQVLSHAGSLKGVFLGPCSRPPHISMSATFLTKPSRLLYHLCMYVSDVLALNGRINKPKRQIAVPLEAEDVTISGLPFFYFFLRTL